MKYFALFLDIKTIRFDSIRQLKLTKLLSANWNNIKNATPDQTIAQYKQKSSLIVSPFLEKQNEQVFPKVISPDVNMNLIFEVENMLESPMSYNLRARWLHLNLLKLKDDYLRMKRLRTQMNMLISEKEKVTATINDTVRRKLKENMEKRVIMESDEMKRMIEMVQEIKTKMSTIEPELFEIEEIVSIACLRLPNYLHASSIIASTKASNKIFNKANLTMENTKNTKNLSTNEVENNLIVYFLNCDQLNKVKSKSKFMTGAADWSHTVLIEPVKKSSQHSSSHEWSFVQTSSEHLGQTNNFYVGVYAKLEQAIVNYIYDKLNKLNETNDEQSLGQLFEHFKSMSLFKSPVAEACSQSFNDTSRTFNVVSFSNSSTNAELLHLLGSSSLSSLVLNFVRTKIKSKYLPWTVYTHGKSYSPKQGQINCFETLSLFKENSSFLIENNSLLEPYKTLDDNVILSDKDLNSMREYKGFQYLNNIKTQLADFLTNMSLDELKQSMTKETSVDNYFICLLKLFACIYKDFNLPIRYAVANANELLGYESLRVDIQAFLPSEQRFIAVDNFFFNF
jgi:hypothetical protein